MILARLFDQDVQPVGVFKRIEPPVVLEEIDVLGAIALHGVVEKPFLVGAAPVDEFRMLGGAAGVIFHADGRVGGISVRRHAVHGERLGRVVDDRADGSVFAARHKSAHSREQRFDNASGVQRQRRGGGLRRAGMKTQAAREIHAAHDHERIGLIRRVNGQNQRCDKQRKREQDAKQFFHKTGSSDLTE